MTSVSKMSNANSQINSSTEHHAPVWYIRRVSALRSRYLGHCNHFSTVIAVELPVPFCDVIFLTSSLPLQQKCSKRSVNAPSQGRSLPPPTSPEEVVVCRAYMCLSILWKYCQPTSTNKTLLEKASIHKSAKTHAGNVLWLVTLTFDLFTRK